MGDGVYLAKYLFPIQDYPNAVPEPSIVVNWVFLQNDSNPGKIQCTSKHAKDI